VVLQKDKLTRLLVYGTHSITFCSAKAAQIGRVQSWSIATIQHIYTPRNPRPIYTTVCSQCRWIYT